MFSWLGPGLTLPLCLSYPYFTVAKFPCLFLVLFYPTIHVFLCVSISLFWNKKHIIISEYLLALCCQHEPFTLGMQNDGKSSHLRSDTSLLYKTMYDLSHIHEVLAVRTQSAAQSNTAIRQQTLTPEHSHGEVYTLFPEYKRLSEIQILKYIHNCFVPLAKCNEPPRMPSTLMMS